MLAAPSVHSAELIVLSGQGTTPGVREVAAAFARTSGHTVAVLAPAGAELAQMLDNGPADLLVASPEPIGDLVKKGKLVSDTVTPWVLAGLGVSVRAGARKPDIATVEAYKAALVAARSIVSRAR
jgi:molybdate transport system substrate-binding protein